jgi:hypothetical protein
VIFFPFIIAFFKLDFRILLFVIIHIWCIIINYFFVFRVTQFDNIFLWGGQFKYWWVSHSLGWCWWDKFH